MSLETVLLTGFAQLLAAECDGSQHVTWRTDGSRYQDGETGIYLVNVPETPDRIVTLTLYSLGDDPTYADSDRGLQIRSRAGVDPTEAVDLDAALCDVLLGRWPLVIAGITVQTLQRTSGASLGQDANQRWSRTSNFTLQAHLPGAHRL